MTAGWAIGAHWCQQAWPEAHALGLSFGWLAAEGLGADPRSRHLADTDGWLACPLDYILTLSLRADPRYLTDEGGAWTRYVSETRDRMADLPATCLAAQMDDEYHSHLLKTRGIDAVREAGPLLAARAEDVRRILGPLVGQGVGMAETGAVLPPTAGIDWWGLNVYLAHGYYTDPRKVAAIYRDAADLGKPLMPILPLFADRGRPALSLETLAACYLPLLTEYASRIWALGVFCLHHPGQYNPGTHGEGRGVLELGPGHEAAVRFLTAAYGRGIPPEVA